MNKTCRQCGSTDLRQRVGRGGQLYPAPICRACEAAAQAARRAAAKAADFEIIEDLPPDARPTPPYAPPHVPAPAPAPAPAPKPSPLEAAQTAYKTERDRRDLKREHRALVEENERLRALLDETRKLDAPPESHYLIRRSDSHAEAVACAIASDWHVEEEVDSAAVHGLNEYTLEIARARSQLFFQHLLKLTDICARDSLIDTINLDVLGDMFTGFLHDENLHANQLAPGDAARFVRDLFFDGIDFLLRESSYVIEGDMIPGNHGRMTKFVWSTDPTGTSLETLAYHSIVDRYRDNPRVRLRVAGQAMVYQRFFERFVVRKIHGYEIKYGGGIGGITIPVRKALAAWDKSVRADLTLFGHFHQRIDGGDFLGNGSLIGYNAYAQSIKASFEQPQQSFYLISARNGGEKSITAPIWVTPAKEATP